MTPINWRTIAAIALAAALLMLGVQTLRVSSLKSSLAAEKAGRAADRDGYRRAQAEAATKALAAKVEQEKEYAQAAQMADADYNALRGRYAELLREQGAGGASSGTAAPSQGGAAAVPEVTAPVHLAVRTLSEADWMMLPALQAYADSCYVFGERLEAMNSP